MRHFSLALACIAAWLATASPSAADDVVISAEAKKRFAAGVALLDDPEGPRYEEAYRAFKSAYEASPSPKILGNIGLCAMKLERDEEAITAYRRYLAEVDEIPDAEREQIERDLTVLEASSGVVEVTTDAKGFTLIDERMPSRGPKVRNVYGPFEGEAAELRLRTGEHRVSVETDAGRSEAVSVVVEPGGTHQVRIDVAAEPDPGAEPEPAPAGPDLPIRYVSRPLTLPAGTLAPALRVRAGQTVEGTRQLLVGVDLVNARLGIVPNLELEAEVAPLEARPRVDYGTASARLTYRFLDEVVELGSAVRIGHALLPGQTRRFLVEPQILRLLAHAGSSLRIDSGFALPILISGEPTVIGMGLPIEIAGQLGDHFFLGGTTGVGVFDFGSASETAFIPVGALAGATVPLDDRPLLDVLGRFTFPQLFLPGRPDDKLEERVFVGSMTLRLYFFL